MTTSRYGWLLPLTLALLLTVSALGATDMWGSDEPRYAQAAREMMERGDYLNLTVNGRPYAKKPPLLMWLQIGAARVTGELREFEARLPSALAGAGSVLLIWCIGSVLLNRRAAFWGALFLAATPVFLKEARMGRMDVLLTFLVCLSWLGFALWERRRASGVITFLLFFLPLPLGILTKWTAPLFVLPPALLYLLFTGQRRRIPWLPGLLGLLITAAPILVWADFEEFEKIVGGTVHQQPFWYHLVRMPLVSMPFAILVPGMVVLARGRNIPGTERRGLLVLAAWIVVNVVVLSFSGSKRSNYLDPLIPPSALLAGWFAASVLAVEAGRLRRRFCDLPLAVIGALAVGAGMVLLIRPQLLTLKQHLDGWNAVLRVAGAVVAAGGGVLLFAGWRGRTATALGTFTALVAAGCLFAFAFVNPARDPSRSVLPLVEVFHDKAAPDALLGYSARAKARSKWPSLKWVFYAERRIQGLQGPKETLEWLRGAGERHVIIKRRTYRLFLDATGGALPPDIRIEGDDCYRSVDSLILSNRKGPGEPITIGTRR